jgi:hypothetical protein
MGRDLGKFPHNHPLKSSVLVSSPSVRWPPRSSPVPHR